MPRLTTPAQYVILLIDLAESLGCDRARLLEETSFAETGLAGIGARVGESDFIRLVENALAQTDDPALGLKLGLKLNLSAHAVLGQVFMTCRDLGQVMELFMRYYHLLAPALELVLEENEESCSLIVMGTAGLGPRHFSYELVFAGFLNTLKGMLNLEGVPLSVAFPYPAPEHAALYRDSFGARVQFDAERGRISWPRSLMETPLPSSNQALLALYEQECARLLADLEGEESVAEQTLRLLRKLEGQYPQMPQVANMLNLSPRTYRRRLEREGHAFQELLDLVRAEHATHYLRHTRLPLATIAYNVGFNDASNFRRAYARWTGHSPREVRDGAA
jgi:AraC-like DNA-binding protein